MRRACLLIATFFLSGHLFCQKSKADSLAALLTRAKADTVKVTLLWQMADALKSSKPDTSLHLSQQALELARKIKYTEGESRALGIIANSFVAMGNYPPALEYYIKKLTIEEKRNNPRNLASVTMNIGIVYFYQEEFDKSLSYYRRADSIIETNNVTDFKYLIALNQGDLYFQLKQYDSSYYYFQKSLKIAIQQNSKNHRGQSLTGLGNVNSKKQLYEEAKRNYLEALPWLHADNNEEVTCEASLGLAKLYQQQLKNDSALYFARQALFLSQKDGFISWQLKATDFMNTHFKNTGRIDSAYRYLVQAQTLHDSINSKERIRQLQVLSINEQLRQDDLAEQKRKSKKERMQQLQLLFIGIFIPAFFLFTLLLSRRKIHVNVIRFLGVISLLILFEYLTLLLHPYVLEFTNHIPILELLIFVCIAAVIIRLHHKIEHWFINKLIQNRQQKKPGQLTISEKKISIKKPSG